MICSTKTSKRTRVHSRTAKLSMQHLKKIVYLITALPSAQQSKPTTTTNHLSNPNQKGTPHRNKTPPVTECRIASIPRPTRFSFVRRHVATQPTYSPTDAGNAPRARQAINCPGEDLSRPRRGPITVDDFRAERRESRVPISYGLVLLSTRKWCCACW